MKKKILVLFGHPNSGANSSYFANEYERGAREGGFDVHRINIGDLTFDPVLHKGYTVIQELEPDLVRVQNEVKWCDHLVLFYPAWFSTMPALLKGMFDRMWLPMFAYHFRKNGLGWEKLLKGRTARVFVTSDSPPFLARFIFGDSTNEITRAILGFAGIRARVKKIGPMKNITPERKASWGKHFLAWGRRGY